MSYINKLKFEGKIFDSNNYGAFKVIEYINTNKVLIEFVNTKTIIEVSLCNIKNGSVKDPFLPKIYGIGYFGIGKFSSRENGIQLKCYKIWKEILNRCYNTKNVSYSNYGGNNVSVCPEWHNYQNFAKWWYDNCKNESFCLDKDLLYKGNKEYHPDKCCFIPMEINSILTNRKHFRGKYPIGVRKNNSSFLVQIMHFGKKVHLGSFNTIEEAFYKYKVEKEKYIKEVADKYKNELDEKVYKALYNYKIEITD